MSADTTLVFDALMRMLTAALWRLTASNGPHLSETAAQVYDAAGIDEVGYIGSHLNPWVILQSWPRIQSERISKDIRSPSLP